LIPLDSPDAGFGDADLAQSLSDALENRPEIRQAGQQIQAASQRLNMATKDVLPMLNLVMGSYVYGLNGQTDFGQAYTNQFAVGRPTMWAGLVYEKPFGNRGPRALQEQRVLELQRATRKIRPDTPTVRAEVEVAVREVSTTRGEMLSRHAAMLAEQDQVNYLFQRWRLLAGDQQVAGVVFNDLLDAQDRRAGAEFDFVTAQVAHRIAWVNLRKVTGTLFECSALTSADLAAARDPVPPPPPPMEAVPTPTPPTATSPTAAPPAFDPPPFNASTLPPPNASIVPGPPPAFIEQSSTEENPQSLKIVPLPPISDDD
jgi:outer membrane protein TolC